MKKYLALISISFFLFSCGSSKPKILSTSSNPVENSSNYDSFYKVDTYSNNKKYGLSGKFPVKVGDMSVDNQRKYLASLAGPNGEEVSFHRRGSCCGYKSKNAIFGTALVDVYEVKYKGLKEPILVYVSFYDKEKLYIPVGFTKRKR